MKSHVNRGPVICHESSGNDRKSKQLGPVSTSGFFWAPASFSIKSNENRAFAVACGILKKDCSALRLFSERSAFLCGHSERELKIVKLFRIAAGRHCTNWRGSLSAGKWTQGLKIEDQILNGLCFFRQVCMIGLAAGQISWIKKVQQLKNEDAPRRRSERKDSYWYPAFADFNDECNSEWWDGKISDISTVII